MCRQVALSIRVAFQSALSGKPLLRLAMAAACGVGLLAVAGCGGQSDRPALGRVHGRVTLDGKPLAKAGVGFQPKGKGRESFATTDENGEYELNYRADVQGAGAGDNAVRITKQTSHDWRSETVPAKYNRQSTLRFEVKAGEDNVANFDLLSK